MLLFNARHELWIGERRGASTWQFPQGGVEKGSTPEQSALRELREELGLKRRHLGIPVRLRATHRYDFSHTPAHWVTRWRGQQQSFWAVKFLGRDQDIDVERHEPPEFSRWGWCPIDEVMRRVDPIRREGYAAPLAEFRALHEAALARAGAVPT